MAGGQQINVGQGTLTVDGSASQAATGSEATTAQGDVGRGNSVRLRSRKVGGGTATHLLSGQTVPVSIGAVTPTPTKTPTSIAALLSAGSFGKTQAIPLQGTSATASAGSVSIPTAQGVALTTFTLTSTSTGTKPYTIGQPFKQGHVAPTGISVSGAQVSVVNLWPDGSAKFAIISGTASLTANVASTVTIATGTPSSGTALTTTQLKATGITASIGCGSFGTASWATTDWDSPFKAWVTGHLMSSWIYRKQVGSDPHLVAWLEVRYYSTGAVEVLPWIENGYLMVASPTSKSATYTFTLGGTGRFSQIIDIPHHCRTVLLSGSAVSHWLGTDPEVIPQHEADYLQATKLVPAYDATVSPTAANVTKQPTSFVPFQAPTMENPNAMGTGGFGSQIGLLPEWDVLALTTSASMWKSIHFNHYSLGRYAIHYRNELTNLPIVFTDTFSGLTSTQSANLCLYYPAADALQGMTHMGSSSTGTYVPVPTGTNPPGIWVDTHHPSTGFMPYLLSGRYYFLEELQFAATANYLRASSSYRQGSRGVFDSLADQTRGFAFDFRTLAQAAAITPDADTSLQTALRDSVKWNVSHYYSTYVSPGLNNFGFIHHSSVSGNNGDQTTSDAIHVQQTWMQDYSIACVGYAKDLVKDSLDTTTQTRFEDLFSWHAKAVVGRLGGSGSTEFLYRNAVPYEIAMAPVDNADLGSGTSWYSSWGAIYNATFGGSSASTSGNFPYAPDCPRVEGGNLVGGTFADTSTSGGYWGYMQPALSYAVRNNVSGAETGWRRLRNAPNWYSQLSAYDVSPLWAVKPTAVPKWRRGQAVNEWREISGSSMSNTPPPFVVGEDVTKKIDAWNGLAIDTRTNTVWSLANGGHNNYHGNEVMRLPLGDDSPAWVQVLGPTASGNITNASPAPARYNDGRPASNHSYYAQQFIERHNRAVRVGSQACSISGTSYYDVDAWDVDTAVNSDGWAARYTYPVITGSNNTPGAYNGNGVCKDPDTEKIYVFINNSAMRVFTPSTAGPTGVAGSGGTWATVGSLPIGECNGQLAAMAYDTRRSRILIARGAAGGLYPYTATNKLYIWTESTGAFTEVTPSGSGLATLNAAKTSIGMVYVPYMDAYIVRLRASGGAILKINASTWEVTALSTTGGSSIPEGGPPDVDPATYENVYSRILFVPSLRGVVYYPRYTSNLWFLRLY